jgi:hypothetical protein
VCYKAQEQTKTPFLMLPEHALPCRSLSGLSNWGKSVSSPIFPASIRRTFAERPTWQPDRAKKQPPSFRRFSTTAASSGTAGTGALSRLGVARANALQSRTSQGADADLARVRALAAYKDFLTLWKDADPDIPILKEAKAEYAKLQ